MKFVAKCEECGETRILVTDHAKCQKCFDAWWKECMTRDRSLGQALPPAEKTPYQLVFCNSRHFDTFIMDDPHVAATVDPALIDAAFERMKKLVPAKFWASETNPDEWYVLSLDAENARLQARVNKETRKFLMRKDLKSLLATACKSYEKI